MKHHIEIDLALEENSKEAVVLKYLTKQGKLGEFFQRALHDYANDVKKNTPKTDATSTSQETMEVMRMSLDSMNNAMDKVYDLAVRVIDLASATPQAPQAPPTREAPEVPNHAPASEASNTPTTFSDESLDDFFGDMEIDMTPKTINTELNLEDVIERNRNMTD